MFLLLGCFAQLESLNRFADLDYLSSAHQITLQKFFGMRLAIYTAFALES